MVLLGFGGETLERALAWNPQTSEEPANRVSLLLKKGGVPNFLGVQSRSIPSK